MPGFLCESAASGRVFRQVGGASRDELGRARNELGVCLIFSPSLNDLPEKRTMSELFAGFSRHV